MARGLNKAMLIGHLGRDPETRYSQDGNQVTKFSVATSESWKDKSSGEKREQTEWHNCVCFGRTAEVAGQYLRKGAKVYVEGKIQTSSWESDGIKRYKTDIVVRDFQMLDSRRGNGEHGQHDSPYDEPRQQARQAPPIDDDDDFDDDIPF